MIARRALRKKFLTADIGITGANFAIAETGMISITENEGNARLTAALPKMMISLLGIEKICQDLALFLPLLATAGAGQTITCYNSMYGGPRQPGESDGPSGTSCCSTIIAPNSSPMPSNATRCIASAAARA